MLDEPEASATNQRRTGRAFRLAPLFSANLRVSASLLIGSESEATMQPPPLIAFPCPSCENLAISQQPERGRMAECPFCRYRTRRPDAKPFTRRDWDAANSPKTLREAWSATGRSFNRRKARLIACGVARIGFDWCRNAQFLDAVEYGEAQADGLEASRTEAEVMSALVPEGYDYPISDWGQVALDCAQCNLAYPAHIVSETYPGVVLGVYRDLLPNPFTRIVWNPDWFTSTVRELAQVMYARREFSAMPILADALQDADCDNEQILNHCRAEKLHARGCWVLDAILGKM